MCSRRWAFAMNRVAASKSGSAASCKCSLAGPSRHGPSSTWLSESALAGLKEHTPNYFLDESKGYLPTKFFNHCEHCGAKQGEPGSAGGHVFQPESYEAAQRIMLHYYNRPIEASCHYDDVTANYFVQDMKRGDDDEPPERAMLRYLVE